MILIIYTGYHSFVIFSQKLRIVYLVQMQRFLNSPYEDGPCARVRKRQYLACSSDFTGRIVFLPLSRKKTRTWKHKMHFFDSNVFHKLGSLHGTPGLVLVIVTTS